MVEHLEFFMKMAVGEVETHIEIPENRIERYQESLYNHRPMPRDFQQPLLRKGQLEDLRYGSLEEAKEAYLASYDAYEAYYKAHPEAMHPNTMFGDLDKELWDLINRKHTHHHFHQFGLV
ncbi:MAG: phenylacetic acid degradation bifunctional protein PaaZ, partial [Bacteroidota bacterium]